MKIVIDIPESIKEHIIDGSFGVRSDDEYTLATAVMNGTPLPKETNNLYTDLCEYRNILDQTINNINITQGDLLYGKWLAYTDCLTMIIGIINKCNTAGTGSRQNASNIRRFAFS